jgi:hypothetical protein
VGAACFPPTVPAVANLQHYDDGAYLDLDGHTDLPLVMVFADLPISATQQDFMRIVRHLERVSGFLIATLYIDVVTDIHGQRVLLIRVPK